MAPLALAIDGRLAVAVAEVEPLFDGPGKALHHEANLHQRRQLALAMMQDVQSALTWQQQVQGHLAALASYLDEQVTASLQTLPLPWDQARVEALRQDLIRTDAANRQAGMQALTALLQQTAATAWSDSTIEALGESLAESFATAFTSLQEWSVATWLRITFPPTSQRPTDAAEKGSWAKRRNGMPPPAAAPLSQWLDQLQHDAHLLWPSSTDQLTEQWCLLPQSSSATPPGAPISLHPDLDRWANAHPNRGYQMTGLPDLVVVQRMSVLV